MTIDSEIKRTYLKVGYVYEKRILELCEEEPTVDFHYAGTDPEGAKHRTLYWRYPAKSSTLIYCGKIGTDLVFYNLNNKAYISENLFTTVSTIINNIRNKCELPIDLNISIISENSLNDFNETSNPKHYEKYSLRFPVTSNDCPIIINRLPIQANIKRARNILYEDEKYNPSINSARNYDYISKSEKTLQQTTNTENHMLWFRYGFSLDVQNMLWYIAEANIWVMPISNYTYKIYTLTQDGSIECDNEIKDIRNSNGIRNIAIRIAETLYSRIPIFNVNYFSTIAKQDLLFNIMNKGLCKFINGTETELHFEIIAWISSNKKHEKYFTLTINDIIKNMSIYYRFDTYKSIDTSSLFSENYYINEIHQNQIYRYGKEDRLYIIYAIFPQMVILKDIISTYKHEMSHEDAKNLIPVACVENDAELQPIEYKKHKIFDIPEGDFYLISKDSIAYEQHRNIKQFSILANFDTSIYPDDIISAYKKTPFIGFKEETIKDYECFEERQLKNYRYHNIDYRRYE